MQIFFFFSCFYFYFRRHVDYLSFARVHLVHLNSSRTQIRIRPSLSLSMRVSRTCFSLCFCVPFVDSIGVFAFRVLSALSIRHRKIIVCTEEHSLSLLFLFITIIKRCTNYSIYRSSLPFLAAGIHRNTDIHLYIYIYIFTRNNSTFSFYVTFPSIDYPLHRRPLASCSRSHVSVSPLASSSSS